MTILVLLAILLGSLLPAVAAEPRAKATAAPMSSATGPPPARGTISRGTVEIALDGSTTISCCPGCPSIPIRHGAGGQ